MRHRRLRLLGVGEPDWHRIRTDAGSRFLASHHTDERLEARLCRRPLRVARLAHLGRDGGDGRDRAALVDPHVADRLLDGVEPANEVIGDEARPCLRIMLPHRPPFDLPARRMDEDVEASKLSDGGVEGTPRGLGIGEIGLERSGLHPMLADGGNRLLGQIVAGLVYDRDFGAAARELLRSRTTHPAAAPGHQRHLSRKLLHCTEFLPSSGCPDTSCCKLCHASNARVNRRGLAVFRAGP